MADQEKVPVLTIRAPKEVHETLKAMAFATGQSINEIVLHAIRDHLSTADHRALVDGLLERVREQYRVALDKLADL